jgi:hypothetical protein
MSRRTGARSGSVVGAADSVAGMSESPVRHGRSVGSDRDGRQDSGPEGSESIAQRAGPAVKRRAGTSATARSPIALPKTREMRSNRRLPARHGCRFRVPRRA